MDILKKKLSENFPNALALVVFIVAIQFIVSVSSSVFLLSAGEKTMGTIEGYRLRTASPSSPGGVKGIFVRIDDGTLGGRSVFVDTVRSDTSVLKTYPKGSSISIVRGSLVGYEFARADSFFGLFGHPLLYAFLLALLFFVAKKEIISSKLWRYFAHARIRS